MALNNLALKSFELFPEPSLLAPLKAPPRLPGINSKTTEALLDILKENHAKWHIFFDDAGRHNHITHQLLAIWAFGAHQDLLRGSYNKNIPLQRPKPKTTKSITSSNFNDHLGDQTYYSAYLDFFDNVVQECNGDSTSLMEKFVFAVDANFGKTIENGQHPQMLCRFLASILHPMIHFGYGAEFGLPGMLSEGLAQTAIHDLNLAPFIPESLFTLVLNAPNSPTANTSPVHAFTVVARILADPQFKIPGIHFFETYHKLLDQHATALLEYANQWTVDVQTLASDPSEIDRKVEELQWTNTILYAVSGYRKDEEFNADFIYMHLVTSALFLPILVAGLSPTAQALLLRAYFITSLVWWIINGRPNLDITSFIGAEDPTNNNQSHPISPNSHLVTHPHALSISSSPSCSSPATAAAISANPNPWLYLIQQASVHPDDHFPKLLRALMHFSLMYGGRKASDSEVDFGQTELAGAQMLDGTLFVRAAALTAKRMENAKADEYISYWDRQGFFKGEE
ncbi:hypothetical protein GGU10DRAFT_378952 [Lentinula aff. detonsa]|uniref:Questin oxidase n=1 Tax=Lentinula aff. detonsa TaxID=2804958 RepID=A0AA38KCL0_9AGAR|nr:hypothetical protein GGU10DRAFT_378952 [Lentinula aff. detonsa]